MCNKFYLFRTLQPHRLLINAAKIYFFSKDSSAEKIKKIAREKENHQMYYAPIKNKYIDPFTDFGFKNMLMP